MIWLVQCLIVVLFYKYGEGFVVGMKRRRGSSRAGIGSRLVQCRRREPLESPTVPGQGPLTFRLSKQGEVRTPHKSGTELYLCDLSASEPWWALSKAEEVASVAVDGGRRSPDMKVKGDLRAERSVDVLLPELAALPFLDSGLVVKLVSSRPILDMQLSALVTFFPLISSPPSSRGDSACANWLSNFGSELNRYLGSASAASAPPPCRLVEARWLVLGQLDRGPVKAEAAKAATVFRSGIVLVPFLFRKWRREMGIMNRGRWR